MIELTNAYSYFASAMLLLGWILTSNNKGSRVFFGTGFFLAFGIYLVSSYIQFTDIETLLQKLCLELLALSGAGYILTKLKSSPILNFLLFIIALTGFSQYAFHSDRTGGLKIENIAKEGEFLLELSHDFGISTLDDVKHKFQLKIEPAFKPIHSDQTELDDFYLIDLPNNSTFTITQVFEQLKKVVGVDWVEYNEEIELSPVIKTDTKLKKNRQPTVYNDALAPNQWSFETLNMNQYFKTLESLKRKWKKTSVLAILDTGIDSRHEDIYNNFKSIKNSYDNDQKGHGTHCAGIAGAVTNNGLGIASFIPNNKWVNITSIKVLNRSGGGTQRDIINGIIEATDSGVDVISMSLGARANQSRERAYKQAIDYANKKNVIVIVAAGNSNLNANTFAPANTRAAITVSAIDRNNNKASFSNYFSDMNYAIAAPGVDILSTVPGNGYAKFSGTSMAAPHVAGLVAIMKAIRPSLTTKEAIDILQKTGMDSNDTPRTGKIINPSEALLLLTNK